LQAAPDYDSLARLAGQAKHLWQETAHGGEHTCQEGYQYGPDLNIALT